MATGLCSLKFLAGLLFFCQPAQVTTVGYIEGDYVLIAPVETARIVTLPVERGARVEAGTTLALLDDTDLSAQIAQQEASLTEAIANLRNLELGRRREELAVIEAALESAKAQAEDAALTLARKQDLFKGGFGTKADLDAAKTSYDVAAAMVRQTSANLDVAKLPARPDELAAANDRVKQANAALDNLHWRERERQLKAPSRGRVFDIIRHVGEMAAPQSPVISFLPDEAIKIKFYIAEADRATLSPQSKLKISCDGCQGTVPAHVTYIAPDAEFTPPVIYSTEARQKLVFLVEAKADSPLASSQPSLQPGQIVDVAVDAP